MKPCTKCKVIKLLTDFHKKYNTPDGVRSRCKECSRLWYLEKTQEERNQRPAKRFFFKLKKTKTCWIWIGAQDGHGYGILRFEGHNMGAHRFSLLLHGTILDRKLVVDHLCKNKLCVNPKHLELVTQKENVGRGLAKKVFCKRGHELAIEQKFSINKQNKKYRYCGACCRVRYQKNKNNSLTQPQSI